MHEDTRELQILSTKVGYVKPAKGYTMPAAEIMHKFYHHQKMSNGKMIKNLAQAKAIASQYGPEGEEKKKKFVYAKK